MLDEQIENQHERPAPSHLLLKTFIAHVGLLILFLSVLYWSTK